MAQYKASESLGPVLALSPAEATLPATGPTLESQAMRSQPDTNTTTSVSALSDATDPETDHGIPEQKRSERPDPIPSQQQPSDSYLDSLQPPSQDDYNRICEQQERKETEDESRKSLSLRSPDSLAKSTCNEAQYGAAEMIQRTYRGYKTRRELNGLGLDASASTKWTHLVKEVRWREATKPKPKTRDAGQADTVGNDNKNKDEKCSDARDMWKLASTVALKAGGDLDSIPLTPASPSQFTSPGSSNSDSLSWHNSSSSSAPNNESVVNTDQETARHRSCAATRERRQQQTKTMGIRYFLEMVDLKHRYGSNLRAYHAEWTKSDTRQNFFYWLDHGEGQNVELETCPRERLDREMVRYLTREERKYYLVEIDTEGRLCWAKNGERITTSEEFRDSKEGIVNRKDDTPVWRSDFSQEGGEIPASVLMNDESSQKTENNDGGGGDTEDSKFKSLPSSPSSSSPRSSRLTGSALEQDVANKYATPEFDGAGKNPIQRVRHMSTGTIFNKLLRRSVRRNTWIFVADSSFRLYVGIKNSGAFQHSSFLQGGRIAAAGLIKAKDGQLRSLSPLSGHYRPPPRNFRAFTKNLRGRGVDMRRVSISKAYAVLIGLETYLTTKKKTKRVAAEVGRRKARLMDPEMAKEMEEAEKDGSKSAKREREVLETEERRREEQKIGRIIIKKLKDTIGDSVK